MMRSGLQGTGQPDPAVSDLELALHLAATAGRMAMALRRDSMPVESKDDGSPVTEVDLEVEQALRTVLQRSRPDDAIVGEEFGGTIGRGRCWLLDPIDGTTDYIKGGIGWGVLVSLLEDGRPRVAVAHQPARERTLWGSRRHGAFADGHAMKMTSVRSLGDATICDDVRGSISRGHDHPIVGLARRCRSWRPPEDHPWIDVLLGKADLGLLMLGGGGPWDWVPIDLLATEAGGRMSDTHGNPYWGRSCPTDKRPDPRSSSCRPSSCGAPRSAGRRPPLKGEPSYDLVEGASRNPVRLSDAGSPQWVPLRADPSDMRLL